MFVLLSAVWKWVEVMVLPLMACFSPSTGLKAVVGTNKCAEGQDGQAQHASNCSCLDLFRHTGGLQASLSAVPKTCTPRELGTL